jgi:hypothetical protein
VGAALACAWVGDISDLVSLVPRLTAGLVVASILLVALMPRGAGAGTAGACRAGLFDCSLPGWPVGGWRSPQRWPLLLAALVMLPMMASLPLMVELCRGDLPSPQAVLALHFAAMFAPAVLVVGRPGLTRFAPLCCGALLVAGAVVSIAAPAQGAWWGVAIAQGAAWSVAWAAQLNDRSWRSTSATPLLGALLNAAFVLATGWALSRAGLPALAAWALALGAVAGLAALVTLCGKLGVRVAATP